MGLELKKWDWNPRSGIETQEVELKPKKWDCNSRSGIGTQEVGLEPKKWDSNPRSDLQPFFRDAQCDFMTNFKTCERI